MNTTSVKTKYYKIILILIFILGIFLRSCTFVMYRPLWRDECSLALSIYFGKFIDLWGILLHTQSAPPIFMTISKIFCYISPANPEYSLRIFPFLCGILSIYLFFLITKQFFKSKSTILIANSAFIINTQLIYYSHEFKQYSTDVMIVLGCILYLSKLDFSNLTVKKILLHSTIIAILPLLSLPSIFVIAAWLLLKVFEKNNIKKIILGTLPIFFINILYYLFILFPSRKIMLNDHSFLWGKGFLTFDINVINYVLSNNLAFYFQQCKFIIIPIILTLCGIITLIKRKLEIDKLILITLIMVVIASFLSIYPIQERVSLYLLPLMILLIVLPFDYFERIWIKIICIILLCFIFCGKFNYNIIPSNFESPDIMIQILKSKYQDGDYIIYNDASDSQFKIYSYLYNFNTYGNKIGKFQLTDYGEDWYYSILDTLPKGKRYWFFYSYDISIKPVIPFLKNWAKRNSKILYENSLNNKSYLLYIEL